MHQQEAPPVSAANTSATLVGVISLVFLIVNFWFAQPNTLTASVSLLFGTALPMVIWIVFIEKAYSKPSTGLCFSFSRPASEVLRITYVKIVGLTVTLLGGYFYYDYAWWYNNASYRFYFDLVVTALPYFLCISPIYVFMTSRYMAEPKDGLWHFGSLILLDIHSVSFQKVQEHLLAWGIKLFFLAFMMSIFPGTVADVLRFRFEFSTPLVEPEVARLLYVVIFLVKVLFLFDVCFGTIGYLLTLRVLDSHVVSPNPYLSAWVVAAACYPPLIIMGNGGPLDYRAGTSDWYHWFSGHGVLLWGWAAAIVALVAIYAWATVVFGIRFSNLTNRGVITNGPYRYFKHPAYLSKNLFWWLVHVPFLSTIGTQTAVQNCLLLLMVNMIYFARAKTEEKHLLADPAYVDYSNWIARNGLLERLIMSTKREFRRVKGRTINQEY